MKKECVFHGHESRDWKIYVFFFLFCRLQRFLPTLAALTLRADGYSRGAPQTQCGYMTPKHGYQPQVMDPYVTIKVGTKSLTPRNQVEVNMESRAGNFRGFMLRAEILGRKNKGEASLEHYSFKGHSHES